MTASLIHVADGITASLNGGSFVLPFVAERSYADWDIVLEEATKLFVDVVPVGYTDDVPAEDRDSYAFATEVDVGVRYLFPSEAQDQQTGRIHSDKIDEHVELLEQFALFIPSQDIPDAQWQTTFIRLAYHQAMLRDNRMYLGIVRFRHYMEGLWA